MQKTRHHQQHSACKIYEKDPGGAAWLWVEDEKWRKFGDLKQILPAFKRIRNFRFFYTDNCGWAKQIINRRIIVFDGNDDRDDWIAMMLGQACFDARPNVKRSPFECMDQWSCLNAAIWDVYVVTDRPDTPSSRERRVKWSQVRTLTQTHRDRSDIVGNL
jgi:hypothetical protein